MNIDIDIYTCLQKIIINYIYVYIYKICESMSLIELQFFNVRPLKVLPHALVIGCF